LTRRQVTYQFVTSFEATELVTAFDSLLNEFDNGAFISTLFETYFLRKPDNEGYTYWTLQMNETANTLESGIYTIENVLSSSQFVTINTDTVNHTGNVMIAKA
jgi:hypothetical protein